jgi:hypothetical protein
MHIEKINRHPSSSFFFIATIISLEISSAFDVTTREAKLFLLTFSLSIAKEF